MRHGLSLVFALSLAACGTPDCEPTEKVTRWNDADGDGFGLAGDTVKVCPGDFKQTAARADDCDDANPDINPWSVELCNGIDDDCDGRLDERFTTQVWYPDGDGDGFGTNLSSVEACARPEGHADNTADCDDTDVDVNPQGLEICDGNDNDCDTLIDDDDMSLDPASRTVFWHDGDGDGYGDPNDERPRCAQPTGTVTNSDDCDDVRMVVNPAAIEICDGFDDNCDGTIDEEDPAFDTSTLRTWFADSDLDGLGDSAVTTLSCSSPGDFQLNDLDCDDTDELIGRAEPWFFDGDGDGAGVMPAVFACEAPVDHVTPRNGQDCDDTNDQLFPNQIEICDLIDNNCDTRIDDADDELDGSTGTDWFFDGDRDGFGDPLNFIQSCNQPPNSVTDNLDCDDNVASVHPGVVEVCDFIDNDCNGAVDDDDPFVDPFTYNIWYADTDNDGVGDLFNAIASCDPPAGYVADPTDCSDSNPGVGAPTLWHEDLDGDGWGSGALAGPSCLAPGPTFVENLGIDCDDASDTIYPGAEDVCGDGLDADCDGFDDCALPPDCAGHLARNPLALSGVYDIEPLVGGDIRQIYCDMDTDEGGWTLVASSTLPLNDASAPYDATLQTLTPTTAMSGVWPGMRSILDLSADVRFACKVALGAPAMTVDLSFYNVDWYHTITTGSDLNSCFHEGGATGDGAFAARKDNLTGATRAMGDAYSSGVLEGEDFCGDAGDFAIDFDDRGLDGNPNDGTDWGEDDGTSKCGTNGAGAAWFIFVRP